MHAGLRCRWFGFRAPAWLTASGGNRSADSVLFSWTWATRIRCLSRLLGAFLSCGKALRCSRTSFRMAERLQILGIGDRIAVAVRVERLDANVKANRVHPALGRGSGSKFHVEDRMKYFPDGCPLNGGVVECGRLPWTGGLLTYPSFGSLIYLPDDPDAVCSDSRFGRSGGGHACF